LNTFDFLNKTMQHDPLQRPTWQEMTAHPMLSQSAQSLNDKITLDIIFDQEPAQGVQFKDNKIFVNTRDPTLYERLHKQAVARFMEEHMASVEDNENNILLSQDRALKKLFPRISTQLTGQQETEEEK
jgi:serine/threonine protein kinase